MELVAGEDAVADDLLLEEDAASSMQERAVKSDSRRDRVCSVANGGRLSVPVKRRAYSFDGMGNYSIKNEWDIASASVDGIVDAGEGSVATTSGKEFNWYHVELPKGDSQMLSLSAQYLIEVLCPPLKLQDILALVSNGPYVAHVDGALIFRVNSPGPAGSDFTLRLSARITESSVVTVSHGRVPRLDFSPTGQSLLSEIPSLGGRRSSDDNDDEASRNGSIVIKQHVLEFLLTMNHSEEADNPVPRTVSNLVVHIVDTHVDQVQDIVTKLEMELDSVELQLDKGGSQLKKQMLDDRRFPKMHLNLQRLLQIVSHGEQVFPRVKEKCATKIWFASEDITALEELVGRLRRLKENLGFLVNRVAAVQASLDSWQAEQINRKLYYLSFLSMIFLPLSIVTGIFGMNVGGVPWTGQKDPELKDGFINVMLLCALIVILLLLGFLFPSFYARFFAWRRHRTERRTAKWSWSNRLSFLRRNIQDGRYIPL